MSIVETRGAEGVGGWIGLKDTSLHSAQVDFLIYSTMTTVPLFLHLGSSTVPTGILKHLNDGD